MILGDNLSLHGYLVDQDLKFNPHANFAAGTNQAAIQTSALQDSGQSKGFWDALDTGLGALGKIFGKEPTIVAPQPEPSSGWILPVAILVGGGLLAAVIFGGKR